MIFFAVSCLDIQLDWKLHCLSSNQCKVGRTISFNKHLIYKSQKHLLRRNWMKRISICFKTHHEKNVFKII